MKAGDTADISARARRARLRGLSIPEVPLGVKVLAILIVLDGIGGLVGAVLAPFQTEEVPGQLTGPAGVAVGGIGGALLIWLGRLLYRGSRVALDFLIGGYVVFLTYGLLGARWVDMWVVVGVGLPVGFLVYLVSCRAVLRKLENQR